MFILKMEFIGIWLLFQPFWWKSNNSLSPPSLMALPKGFETSRRNSLKVHENKIAIDCKSNSFLIFSKTISNTFKSYFGKFPLYNNAAHFEHELKYLLIVGSESSHNSIYFTLNTYETLQSALFAKLWNALN